MAYAGPEFSARATPAINNYARTSAALGDIRVRLATGERIVRIADDVSSITAAATLQAQNSTLRSTLVNGAKATSFLQIASNGLEQIKAVLENLSELAATANQAGRTPLQYKTLSAQFQSGLTQIDSIVATTTYGGASILDGSLSGSAAASIPTSNTKGDVITLDIPSVTAASLFPVATSLNNAAASTTATTNVGNAQQTLKEAIAKIDAYQVRLDTISIANGNSITGVDQSIDALLGTDKTKESQNEQYLTIRQNLSAALLAQTTNIQSGLLNLLGK